jgi:hypothetical protein
MVRALRPPERLRLAVEMSAEVRALAEAGIRHRSPQLTHAEVERALAVVILGQELAAKALPTGRDSA